MVILAHSYALGLCTDPKCTALHFELKDARGKAFAVMTVGVEHVPSVIKKMQDLAYVIETTRKGY